MADNRNYFTTVGTEQSKPEERAPLLSEEEEKKVAAEKGESKEPLLCLPAYNPQTAEEQKEEPRRTLVVGGAPVQLDALGPIVLNEDGTMSRISNWHDMTEQEHEMTLKLIAKRNATRRAKLLDQMEKQGSN